MLQFHYKQELSDMLMLFPHIVELGVRKITSIQLQSFPEILISGLSVYFINEGRFQWKLDGHLYVLFPGDLVIITPGQFFGNEKGILELGSISWIQLKLERVRNTEMTPGAWSGMRPAESAAFGKLICMNSTPVISNMQDAGRIFANISNEIHQHELGYITRTNQLIDELLITAARHLSRQHSPVRDFPTVFMKLEESLRSDLSHQWSLEEMAAIAGMGTTYFNEKVKNYTGFTPINYLINIRISEAIKLLKATDRTITDIALDTGFYSSQHFSTTFKKLTGYTPGEFRKNSSGNA